MSVTRIHDFRSGSRGNSLPWTCAPPDRALLPVVPPHLPSLTGHWHETVAEMLASPRRAATRRTITPLPCLRVRGLGMLACCIGMLVAKAANPAAIDDEAVDGFKRLLSSPPAHLEVAWRAEAPRSPGAPDTSPIVVRTNQYYLRWQTNAELLALGSLPDSPDGLWCRMPQVQSRYDDEAWWGDSLALHHGVYSNNREDERFERAMARSTPSGGILCLGIGMLRPGTVEWVSSRSFRGQTLRTDRAPCFGEIVVERRKVKAVKFWSPAFPGFVHSARYVYGDSNLPPHVPSQVEILVASRDDPDPTLTERDFILKWRTSETARPREAFVPEGLVMRNGTMPAYTVHYTNGVGYYAAGGELRTFKPLGLLDRMGVPQERQPRLLSQVPYPSTLDQAGYARDLKATSGVAVVGPPTLGDRLIVPLTVFGVVAIGTAALHFRNRSRRPVRHGGGDVGKGLHN